MAMSLFAAMPFLILLSSACTDPDGRKEAAGEERGFSPQSYAEGDTLEPFPSTALEAWFRFHRQADSGFRRGAFLASGINIPIDSLTLCPMPDTSTLQMMAPLLPWSPDSSRAIDIWSYGYQLRRSPTGALILEGGGPDQMVKLIDRSRAMAWQLLFNGPSQIVEAAGWPNRNAIVLGLLNIDPATGEATPDLVLMHLGDSMFTNFRYTGPRIRPHGQFTQAWLRSQGILTE